MNYLIGVDIVNDIVSEPLSLTEAKAWLKVSFDTDNDLINSLITSSRKWLEDFTGQGLGARKMTAYVVVNDYTKEISLPYGPVNSIVSVYDKVSESTVSSTNYELYNGKVRVDYNSEFSITYMGGYSSVPGPLVNDIKRILAWGYQNRGLNFTADQGSSTVAFPDAYTLNGYGYKTVII